MKGKIMLKEKIEKRIEGRYEVIKECIDTISQELAEIYASIESIQILSFYKEDLNEESNMS